MSLNFQNRNGASANRVLLIVLLAVSGIAVLCSLLKVQPFGFDMAAPP